MTATHIEGTGIDLAVEPGKVVIGAGFGQAVERIPPAQARYLAMLLDDCANAAERRAAALAKERLR
jgi:hypothetical protein